MPRVTLESVTSPWTRLIDASSSIPRMTPVGCEASTDLSSSAGPSQASHISPRRSSSSDGRSTPESHPTSGLKCLSRLSLLSVLSELAAASLTLSSSSVSSAANAGALASSIRSGRLPMHRAAHSRTLHSEWGSIDTTRFACGARLSPSAYAITRSAH